MQPIFYTFFSLFKIGDLKNLRSINSNQACATDWLFIDFFQTIILNSELKKKTKTYEHIFMVQAIID